MADHNDTSKEAVERLTAENERLRASVHKAFVWARDARPKGYETAICKIEGILEAALQRKAGE